MTVVFLHIPKSAGTSVRKAIRVQFGRMYLIPARPRRRDLARLAVSSRVHRFDLVVGHVGYGVGRLLPGEVQYFTFLRDPVARVVSEYHFVREREPDPTRRQPAFNLGLLDHARTLSQRDQQVRVLAGRKRYRTTERDLDLARAHAHGMAVGVTERMGPSMQVLAEHLGWSVVPEVDRLNVGRPYPPLADEEHEEIAALNALDMVLWREAMERLS